MYKDIQMCPSFMLQRSVIRSWFEEAGKEESMLDEAWCQLSSLEEHSVPVLSFLFHYDVVWAQHAIYCDFCILYSGNFSDISLSKRLFSSTNSECRRNKVTAWCCAAIGSNRHRGSSVGTSRVISRCYTLLVKPPCSDDVEQNETGIHLWVCWSVSSCWSADFAGSVRGVDRHWNECCYVPPAERGNRHIELGGGW